MPRIHCQICAKRISSGDLCEECGDELVDASPEALAEYIASTRVSPAAPATSPSTSTPPPTSLSLTDPRIPAPEFVAALRQAGLTPIQIAEQLQVSVSTAKELVKQSQQTDLFEATRQWAAQRFIPKILANLDRALDADADGTFSLQVAKDMRIWEAPKTGTNEPNMGEDDTFESWKIQVTKKTKNAARREDGPVVTRYRDGEVIQADAADAESGSAEGSDEGD
jgi:hypothetical protein